MNITESALKDFSRINKILIEQYIQENIKRQLISMKGGILSFKFHAHKVYLYKGFDSEITELLQMNYREIINIDFLNQFIFLKDRLPVRLQRWAETNFLDNIFNEIVQSLIFKRIYTTINNNDEDIEWHWPGAGLAMRMNKNLVFYKLETKNLL
ncbi:hypothetical protein [Paenibacillus sp. GbtcB18]|uniref:hypothetical protein n=1 Tax=Paenibacillus sp. GbtcB18 TaxID=2824763 RepID=UPI001C30E519|nr:hypothetical protein [Paenibacillus sp. GbtcB18]